MEVIVLSCRKKKNETHRYVFRTDAHRSIEAEIVSWADGELACDCARAEFIKEFFDKRFKIPDCGDNLIKVDAIVIDNEKVYSEL